MEFRMAGTQDLPELVALLVDDELGATRDFSDESSMAKYESAMRAILAQQGNQILVATRGEQIIAMLQLTLIATLSRSGGTRAQIESLRVKHQHRGQGIGKALMLEAIRLSKEAGCTLVQLTTDLSRIEALGFYEGLGFIRSHHGMKLALD